jgi:hypothetical protein
MGIALCGARLCMTKQLPMIGKPRPALAPKFACGCHAWSWMPCVFRDELPGPIEIMPRLFWFIAHDYVRPDAWQRGKDN